MKPIRQLLFILLAILLITACTPIQSKNPVPPKDNVISIRGIVTDSVQGKDGITFLIKGKIETDTLYDEASVTATRDTIVTIQGVNTLVALDFTEIKDNQTLEIQFYGPIAESYPIKAKAGSITIIPNP